MNRDLRFYIERLSFAVCLFTFFAGAYIIGNAWVHPATLSIQLTHLTPWIREDEFGMISWFVCFVSFCVWNITRN